MLPLLRNYPGFYILGVIQAINPVWLVHGSTVIHLGGRNLFSRQLPLISLPNRRGGKGEKRGVSSYSSLFSLSFLPFKSPLPLFPRCLKEPLCILFLEIAASLLVDCQGLVKAVVEQFPGLLWAGEICPHLHFLLLSSLLFLCQDRSTEASTHNSCMAEFEAWMQLPATTAFKYMFSFTRALIFSKMKKSKRLFFKKKNIIIIIYAVILWKKPCQR